MASLKDIAAHCRVSEATVSKVLNPGNSSYRISAATTRRVLQACLELGYQPNRQARALAKGRANRIGIVVDMLGTREDEADERTRDRRRDSLDFVGPVVLGALVQANRLGLDVFQVSRRPGDARTAAELSSLLLMQGELDGVILPVGSSYAPRLLAATGKPVVVVGREANHPDIAHLTVDMEPALRRAVAHLVELGHRELRWVGPRASEDARARLAICRAQAAERGVRCEATLVEAEAMGSGFGAESSPVLAAALAERWSASRPPASAIVCFNDRTAAGVYLLAARRGWRIPEDCSVIGIDDIHARGMTPPLTSLTNMSIRLGEAALELMADVMAGRAAGDEQRRIAAELILRASVGPAGGTGG